MEEVPAPKASLLVLDEQPALTGQNEERLLIGFGVIDAALTRLEEGHVDPDLLELDRRLAVLVPEGRSRRAPSSVQSERPRAHPATQLSSPSVPRIMPDMVKDEETPAFEPV